MDYCFRSDLCDALNNFDEIYYMSDVHIIEWLRNHPMISYMSHDFSFDEFRYGVNRFIDHLLKTVDLKNKRCVLLCAGDICESIDANILFYHILIERWPGLVISVLGNHDIDGPVFLSGMSAFYGYFGKQDDIIVGKTPAANVVSRYYTHWPNGGILLDNDFLIIDELGHIYVVLGSDVLAMDDSFFMQFVDRCRRAKLVIFGTTSIDSSDHDSWTLYQKIFLYIDRRIVILTHHHVFGRHGTLSHDDDWRHPDWVYVCGHIHKDCSAFFRDGSVFLTNNIITEEKALLKCFSMKSTRMENPLDKYSDGIHEINADVYVDFLHFFTGENASTKSIGRIFLVKRGSVIMFPGGEHGSYLWDKKTKRGYGVTNAERSSCIYYFDHILEYVDCAKRFIAPFRQILENIAGYVKSFGGTGSIHGCIVDIDQYCHIAVDPLHLSVYIYYAVDMKHSSYIFFGDVKSVLVNNSAFYNHFCENDMKEFSFPEEYCVVTDVSNEMLHQFYQVSNNVGRLFELFDDSVQYIRLWKDAVLYLSEDAVSSDFFKCLCDE